jgi:hypothetical protein
MAAGRRRDGLPCDMERIRNFARYLHNLMVPPNLHLPSKILCCFYKQCTLLLSIMLGFCNAMLIQKGLKVSGLIFVRFKL